jgi:hypothetical protein
MASPTDVGELYANVAALTVVYGEWTLGNPNQPLAANPDRPTYKQDQFFGIPGIAVGDVVEVGELPVATYPPTHRYAITEEHTLAQLQQAVPNARDVLGIGSAGIQIVHHEPFVRYGGDSAQVGLDERAVAADCAFILPMPDIPHLLGRTFRLTPQQDERARGLRSDWHVVHGPQYEENGLFPDLRQTEFECLMNVVRFAVSQAMVAQQALPERSPQQEQ